MRGRTCVVSKPPGAIIRCVTNGSPAAEAGLEPGDELVGLNSLRLRDILDYRFESAEARVAIEFRRNGRLHRSLVEKDPCADLGLEFEDELFDGLHTCENRCIFCFLHQMPGGLRPSLYVRDDDYRLSFTQGNYITLTNLTDEEMDRICSQKMSPMYISVHATDPELRARMFRNRRAGRIMEQLDRLAEARITMHTQILVCPGVNDGEYLKRSIRDLSELHPWVASIAVVPVGLTKHRAGLAALRSVDGPLAREVMDLCLRQQRESRSRLGARLVFPSDELYLLSGQRIASREAYEGFPQLEDGVGLSRIFLNELAIVRRRLNNRVPRPGRYMLVTGVLASGLVGQLVDILNRIPEVAARMRIVVNDFLGETVTVAGLMAGRDIARALAGVDPGEQVLVPSVALNGDRFLDDMTLAALQAATRADVRAIAPSPAAAWEHVTRSPAGTAVSGAGAAGKYVRE